MASEIPRTPLVGVVMGSRSDWETLRHACEVLAELGIPYETKVVSAHRTPDRLFHYAREAEGRGLDVLIAGAGGAAHLPGMLAAITILPVLGVPVESKVLRGVDSLLSIVQMPRGVPVGTLAIGSAGAANAGLLAAAILARVPGDPRGPGRVPARPRPTPWRSRPNELSPDADAPSHRPPFSPRLARGYRQRSTRTDVHPGRAADGLSRRGPRAMPRTARRAGRPLDGRRPRPTSAGLAGLLPSRPRR